MPYAAEIANVTTTISQKLFKYVIPLSALRFLNVHFRIKISVKYFIRVIEGSNQEN